jgi:hypothetical protein
LNSLVVVWEVDFEGLLWLGSWVDPPLVHKLIRLLEGLADQVRSTACVLQEDEGIEIEGE